VVSSQERVQSTTQLTVRTPVVADPFAEWEKHYAEAMKVATELAESGSIGHARILVDDLEDLDRVLRDFVRISEWLREKDRSLVETMESMAQQKVILKESQQFHTLASALKVLREMESATVRKLN
jgi:hypothetical protein